MTRTVILRNLRAKHEYEDMFPGAFVITATMPHEILEWASEEVYIEEGAASPETVYLARQRQASFANPVLEILPLWKIRAKFMSAHEAMALYAREGRI